LAQDDGIEYPRDVDIRTKLVFAFVAVTFGSMFAFGAFMNLTAGRMINAGTAEQLEGLAESSSDALESIVSGWQERVQLIASRTQLRISLLEYRESRDPADVERIQRILSDAAGSVGSVAALAVYDDQGRLMARAGLPADSIDASLSQRFSPGATGELLFLGAVVTEAGFPRVGYSTALALDGERVGYLLAVLNGVRIRELTDDTTGLGATGEVLVVTRDPAGARTLHPVRHEPATEPGFLLDGENDPSLKALAGEEGVFQEGLTDYMGKPVWAATRYLPDTDWGLVVKFDAAEKRSVVREFRERVFSVGVSLTGIGFLVALFLGLRFAAPIHNLAAAADQIREGNLDARATVSREDEIGHLADTFNHMAGDLQKQVTELHEFKKFFDVSLDLLCIAGTDGYFKRTNPAFERALGWTDEELTSRPFFDLVHPDDVEATRAEIAKLAQGIPTISFMNRFRRSDGSWRHLLWASYPEPETGILYAIAREIEDPQAG